MAGIDHTIIAFKNGQLLEKLGYSTDEDTYTWHSYIPFEYDRDGRFQNMTWGCVLSEYEWSKYYVVRYFRNKKALKQYDSIKYKYTSTDTYQAVAIEREEYNISFMYYKDTNDCYILLGGYGHMLNPYTHFFNRGYGEEFEKKMAFECYRWIAKELYKILCLSLSGDGVKKTKMSAEEYRANIEEEEKMKAELYTKMRWKDWFDMTEEEKNNYRMEYYYDT